MTNRKRKALLAAGLLIPIVAIAFIIAAHILRRQFEPYIREQAIVYLQKRFDSDVELGSLRVSIPEMLPARVVFTRGRGMFARVEAAGISLRHRANPNLPAMFVVKNVSFMVDLGSLFGDRKLVRSVVIDGMEINVPPKGTRPDVDAGRDHPETGVIIEDVLLTNSTLRILPKRPEKDPLQFVLHRIHLESAGKDVAMKYDATLKNAVPPGEIRSKGRFGPWAATDPGDTPLQGDYEFKDADLSVFDDIAGILRSTGNFQGTLDSIAVQGQASVPAFRLTSAGNPVPLFTRFNARVDGTNGDTILKPVIGQLGSTQFTTDGFVVKRQHYHRTISLNVTMTDGNVRDLLTLAMKGSPFMEGRIRLKTKIDIPPLRGGVSERLLLGGNFEISQARFLRSKIQQQIDTLSRRGQGEPKNEEILEVPSGLAGSFNLASQIITFRTLSFAVRGAGVDLAGSYNIKKDDIDLHGTLKLQAKVSETMTDWKRWVLKPIDPFFSKHGAGTFLRIRVTGTSKDPQFGLELGNRDKNDTNATRRSKPSSNR